MTKTTYPYAITSRRSPVSHPVRRETRGVVIHWTVGREAGDLRALTNGHEDVQFYVTKAGKVYQLVPANRCAWHAFATANDTCIGIEHEGSGEPWTRAQLRASARLAAWIHVNYGVPIRHVVPCQTGNWRGLFGHRDLRGIDGNDHTDSVPAGTGWSRYLNAIGDELEPSPAKLARLAVLRAWFGARRKAGWTWARVKRTHNWAEYRRLGGK